MNLEEKINIIKLICEMQSLLEGYNLKNNCKENQLTIKLKILTYLFGGTKSTYFLIKNIGIAKTNLNLLCNELIENKLILKRKDELDSRVVLYSISDVGKAYLVEELDKLGKDFENFNSKKLEDLNKLVAELLKIFK